MNLKDTIIVLTVHAVINKGRTKEGTLNTICNKLNNKDINIGTEPKKFGNLLAIPPVALRWNNSKKILILNFTVLTSICYDKMSECFDQSATRISLLRPEINRIGCYVTWRQHGNEDNKRSKTVSHWSSSEHFQRVQKKTKSTIPATQYFLVTTRSKYFWFTTTHLSSTVKYLSFST